MIHCFLEQPPSSEDPRYHFLVIVIEDVTTYIGTIVYKTFSSPPVVTSLRTLYGDIDQQIANLLDFLQTRGIIDPFLTNHDNQLEDWILSQFAQDSAQTEVCPETPLVSQEDLHRFHFESGK
jgi:hypothetical protein